MSSAIVLSQSQENIRKRWSYAMWFSAGVVLLIFIVVFVQDTASFPQGITHIDLFFGVLAWAGFTSLFYRCAYREHGIKWLTFSLISQTVYVCALPFVFFAINSLEMAVVVLLPASFMVYFYIMSLRLRAV